MVWRCIQIRRKLFTVKTTIEWKIILLQALISWGFTFRPRRSKNRWGKHFVNFSPAMSAQSGKAIRQEVRSWKLHLRSDKSLADLALMFRAQIQGWINYYGCFYKSAMYPTFKHLNRKLCLWATRKFKKLKRHRRRAEHRLGAIAKMYPTLFPHWKLGVRPMNSCTGRAG